LLVNGAVAGTSEQTGSVTMTLYHNVPLPNDSWALFTAPPFPVLKVSPIFLQGGPFPGPVSSSSTLCAPVLCNVPPVAGIPLQAFYLDSILTKPNGKASIQISATGSLTVAGNPGGCGFCWGQKDDGAFDGFVFRVNNPSGSNDWFSVRHGAPSVASGVSTLTGVEIATWDFCGTGGTGSWAEVGIYPDQVATTGVPDTANPFGNVIGGGVAPGIAQWGYPASFYDTPDVGASTTTNYHAGVKWNQGDSCIWVASDTTATGPDPCADLTTTTSYSSPDGFTATAGATFAINWMMKIDWQ
jgi:hypothetical protein